MIDDITFFVDQVSISVNRSAILIDSTISPNVKPTDDLFRIIVLL